MIGSKVGITEGDKVGCSICDTVGGCVGTDDGVLTTDGLELGIMVEVKLGTIEDLELGLNDGVGFGVVIKTLF